MPSTTTPAEEPVLEVTVVLPCLDEAATVATCIRKARSCLDRLNVRGEVLVADNGSSDGSPEIARREGARVLDVPVRGYGAALFAGARHARGRFIIMGDADDSYDFSALGPFVEALRTGADVVIGNRFLGGIEPGAMPWKNRYIGNPLLSGIGRLLFRSRLGDFHCGLRGMSKPAFERLNLQTTGMEFASEMIIKALLLRMRISEVPTVLHRDGRGRKPHLRPWRDGWRHLVFMVLFSPRGLFLYPGLALMAAGLAGFLTTLQAATTMPVLWLLACSTMVMLGFNAVLFSFCARIYAYNQRFVLEDKGLERLFRYLKLEGGVLASAGVLCGAVASVWWSVRHALSQPYTADAAPPWLVVAVASSTALVLAGQTMLVSFLLRLFGVKRRLGGDV